MKLKASVLILLLAALASFAGKQTAPAISGDYLEVRSCDVFTGPCFANAEMGLTGKEAIMVWSVREGSWKGTTLDGLSVIAVLRADGTLGDVRYEPRSGKAVLIVDAKANTDQQEALTDLARSLAGKLIKEVAAVRTSSIDAKMGTCSKSGCAAVKAGELVNISTRCFGENDHVCGNEDIFYQPLTDVTQAIPAFTEMAAFKGTGLNLTWQSTGQRSAFLAAFAK
jgi:Protein of unknown function (DUF1326)